MLSVLLILLAALPVLVGFIYTAAAWHSLSRPVLFAFGGIFEGYIATAAVLYWALSPLTSIGISGTVTSDTAACPLSPYERVIIGVPIVVALQLLAMWLTHRAVVQS